MKSKKNWSFILLVAVLLSFLQAASVYSGSYPETPITLLTAFSPGGGSDISHRLLQKYAKDIIPKPLVIIYKEGAGGELGWTELANAKPDGYFIGGVDLPQIAIQPMLRTKGQSSYKTDDLLPICGIVSDPQIIYVHKDSQWKTLEQFMDFVRANPGKVTAATGGKFSGTHFFLLQFENATDLKVADIPFAGGGKAVAALAGKQVDCYFGSFSVGIRNDALRGLAVGTPERYSLCPDVPTLREKKINLVSIQRRGLCAPKNTPQDRIKYLEEKFRSISAIPEYQQEAKKLGMDNSFLSSSDFYEYIQEQKEFSKTILTRIGILK